MSLVVSEKTLELNVGENIINRIRQLGGVFQRTFIYGFNMRYEGRIGLDCAINLPTNGMFLLAFQFKRFNPQRSRMNIWTFEINNNKARDQHLKLLVTSHFLGFDGVYYAFPLINSQNIHSISPDFLNNTCFVRVADFPAYTFNFTTHMVFLNTKCNITRIMSTNSGNINSFKFSDILKLLMKEEFKVALEKLNRKVITKEELKRFLKEKGIDENIIREFLARNWRFKIKFGLFI